MTKRDFEMKSDGLGIGLFVFGTLNGVLVAQAMLSGIEPESTRVVVKLAALWVQSIGALPSLAFNIVVAVLGALIFLNRAALPPWRHVVGGLLVALGLSVVCGAFSVDAGGLFGDVIGGTVARVHVALGALVGALIIAASLWFVWLRPGELPEEEPMSVRNPDREIALDAADDGVSLDEARALLPDDIHQALAQARAKPVVHAPPPSPYPEDVRRKGEIPAGARPIEASAVKPSVAPIANPAVAGADAAVTGASAYRWTAPGARREVDAPEVKPLEAARPIAGDAPRVLARPEIEEESTSDDRYPVLDADESPSVAAEPPRPSWEGSSMLEDAADEPVDAYGTPLTLVEALRKSEPAPANDVAPIVVADDEFLDELSAPRPIVASVTSASVELATDEADDELDLPARPLERAVMHEIDEDVDGGVDDDLDEALADERELEEPLAPPIAAQDDEEELADDEDDELDEDAEEEDDLDATLSDDDDLEDEADDEDEFADDEDMLAPAVRADAPSLSPVEPAWETETEDEDELEPVASALADDDSAEEPSEAPDEELLELVAAAEARAREPRDLASELASFNAAARARLADAPPANESVAASTETRPRAAAQLDFDSLNTAAPAPAPRSALFDTEPEEPASDAKASSTERDVVLVPQAAPAGTERTPPAPRAVAAERTTERSALLAEIGCLFIDRKRVAVSMLQRQYSMEFDDACRVLDELQDMGLLGPYLGGQRRDILLTREQWLGKVAVS